MLIYLITCLGSSARWSDRLVSGRPGVQIPPGAHVHMRIDRMQNVIEVKGIKKQFKTYESCGG